MRGLLMAAALAASSAAGADPPQRVVSMNLCTDQLAMLVAAPGQIVSVSYLAHDPRASAMASEAKAYPANRGTAEGVFLLDPDLVLAGTYTTRATVEMLRRLGIEVIEFAPANDLEDVGRNLLRIGALLGRQWQATILMLKFEGQRALIAAGIRSHRPRAALHFANNYTLGRGTLAHALVDAAGLTNIADELGYQGGGVVPLEVLVFANPDLVISGQRYDQDARAQEVFDHPAMEAIRSRAGSAVASDTDWICGTPYVLGAIEALVEARDALGLTRKDIPQ